MQALHVLIPGYIFAMVVAAAVNSVSLVFSVAPVNPNDFTSAVSNPCTLLNFFRNSPKT